MTDFDINYAPARSKPLSDKTWADFPQAISPRTEVSWPVQSDLAEELTRMDGHTHLRYQEWRLLLSAAVSGLPVVVTFDTRINRSGGDHKIERKTRTMVVRWLTGPSLDDPKGLPVRIRAAYSGFGHELRVTDIREVAPPATPSATFLDPENSAYVRTN